MFERESKFNQFLLAYFDKVVADIAPDRTEERAPGNGHPPIWVLGHMAIVAEMGNSLLGGGLTHPEWVPVFGPRSSDNVLNGQTYSKDEFVSQIRAQYPLLSQRMAETDQATLQAPHGVEVLKGTVLKTIEDVGVHVLTTHFAFHLAQLSGWRRDFGNGPLF